ncbi:hypothetical protein GCM10009853_057960 [Glycomyces scopariae]
MNGDIEALLRSGLAEQAERAPATVDDPALADLAIAGAHRIRRRRRAAAGATGAGLLVLGAGAFVLQPLLATEDQGQLAADTSTSEVRNELGMEFLIQDDEGYQVINDDGDRVALVDYAPQDVYRLADAYLVVSAEEQTTELIGLDGAAGRGMSWPSEMTYNVVNSEATQFAMVTSNADYTEESYAINDAVIADRTTTIEFTTNFELTLADWSASTTVFTADLWSTTAGQEKRWFFDEQYSWNLESVGYAGYQSAVILDQQDPSFVCVADLEPGSGLAQVGEDCGRVDSPFVQEALGAAAVDETAADLVDTAVAEFSGEGTQIYADSEPADLGDYEDQYYQAEYSQLDPSGRWELSYSRGDSTWILVDYTGDDPAVSILTPPEGAVMPVLDCRPPE